MVGLGGQLSAAEDRQATVQDLEGRLARLSEQADVYQVRWGQEGKGTGQETKHQPAMPRRRKRPRLTLAPSPPRLPFPTLRPTITPYSCTTLPTPQARDGISRLPRTEYPALGEVQKAIEPIGNLWRCAAEWGRCQPEWMDGPLPDVDAEAVAASVDA